MKLKKFPQLLIIVLSFVLVILIGSIFLVLPIATTARKPLSYIDAFFMSTSSVCVTGLVSTAPLATTFSVFGKVVIYFLIQIGGLGVITISMAILSIFGYKIGISERLLVKNALNQNVTKGIVKLVLTAIIISFSFQLVGTIVNMFVFIKEYNFTKALLISLFHSASAFNNAGFDILAVDGTSLVKYKDNVLLCLNTAFLIISGGLGFLVHYEIITKRNWKKLSIHSKLVIKITLIVIVFGFLFIKFSAYNEITWLQAFFSSISSRTAGFQVVDLNYISSAFVLITILLMYIGTSPTSTGGGIKTTTLYTITKTVAAVATGKPPIVYNKRISQSSIIKAFVLVVTSLAWIFVNIVFILMIENENKAISGNLFSKVIFEVFSAFTTTGKSFGITSSLHASSKFLLSLTMLIGRVGPITFISVFARRIHEFEESYYLDEALIIG